jgi:hypothetical protein
MRTLLLRAEVSAAIELPYRENSGRGPVFAPSGETPKSAAGGLEGARLQAAPDIVFKDLRRYKHSG